MSKTKDAFMQLRQDDIQENMEGIPMYVSPSKEINLTNKNMKTVIFKDGTYIEVADGITWEYENDKNWLLTLSK